MSDAAWVKATKNLPTKSAKIRALAALGVARADIARFLDIRYQHVRNVLTHERPAATAAFAEERSQFEHEKRARVQADGTVTIPAHLAAQLGAKPGDALIVSAEDGGIWIATREAGLKRAQTLVRKYVPEGVSLVDELLTERRREVEREEEDYRSSFTS